MQQVNFKHCWIDSASARYEQEYMISFIISQKSVMPDRILRRYLLSSTSPAAASVRLLISTAPLSTLFYSLHAFGRYVNPFMRILNFYTFCPLRHWLPLFGREGARPASNHVFYVKAQVTGLHRAYGHSALLPHCRAPFGRRGMQRPASPAPIRRPPAAVPLTPTQTDLRHEPPASRPRAPLHKTNRQKDLVAVSRDPGAKNAKLFSEN